MLEGVVYDAVDVMFPFHGTIVDRCCDFDVTADAITVSTAYVGMASHIYGRNLIPGWTEENVKRLSL